MWEALLRALIAAFGRELPSGVTDILAVVGGLAILGLILTGLVMKAPHLVGRTAASAKKAGDWASREYARGWHERHYSARRREILRVFSKEQQAKIWAARTARLPLSALTHDERRAEHALAEILDDMARRAGILAGIGDDVMVNDEPWKVVSMTRGRPGIAEGTVTLESRAGKQMILNFEIVNPEYRGNYAPNNITEN